MATASINLFLTDTHWCGTSRSKALAHSLCFHGCAIAVLCVLVALYPPQSARTFPSVYVQFEFSAAPNTVRTFPETQPDQSIVVVAQQIPPLVNLVVPETSLQASLSAVTVKGSDHLANVRTVSPIANILPLPVNTARPACNLNGLFRRPVRRAEAMPSGCLTKVCRRT